MLARAWREDGWLRTALVLGLLLRLGLMLAWIDKPCVRDECTYELLARAILDGRGMVGSGGWLWAPAYPMLMAAHGWVTGFPATVQVTQLAAAGFAIVAVYLLAERVFDRRTARAAAWLHALDPTMVFFTASQWSEAIYAPLLLGVLLALGWARDADAPDPPGAHAPATGRWVRGALVGALVGVCVLFRGVATYMLPILLAGLLVGRGGSRVARGQALACALAAVLVVAPYSAWASVRFKGFVLADRTVGQMMWLGNNEFPPVTFDLGGVRNDAELEALEARGRAHCPTPKRVVMQDDCERARGMAWIRANPRAFLARVPVRVAQLVNPHGFLTRHLRQARHALPGLVVEPLVLLVVAFSAVTLLGGTLGYLAWTGSAGEADGRAAERRWYGLTVGLVVLYHVAAVAALAGLTRYRVPLVPPWSVYAAAVLVAPRATLARAFDGSPWRVAGTFVLVVLAGLMAWGLPSGWPR